MEKKESNKKTHKFHINNTFKYEYGDQIDAQNPFYILMLDTDAA